YNQKSYFQLFEILYRFKVIYEKYSEKGLEQSIIIEGKKSIKQLSQKLENIKNEDLISLILDENNQNYKETLKSNLYKITGLKLNEKSKIIKIISKEYLSEGDKIKLRSFLNKLSIKELKLFKSKVDKKIIEKKEILKELINFNQNLDITKFGFPEEKILIDRDILDRFYRDCVKKDPNFAEIFLDIVKPLLKGNSISLKEFIRLEDLVGKSVPHRKIIGRKNQVCIEASKSNDLAELLGIIWGRGRIDIKHPRYDLVIYLKGFHKDPTFIRHLKSLITAVLKVDENKIGINPSKESLRLSGKVIIYEILKYGIFPKESDYSYTIPLWIFENKSFILSFLRGILSVNSIFVLHVSNDCSVPRYNLQFLVNRNIEKYVKVVNFLFSLFDLECNTNINSLSIHKKSDLNRIINEFLHPIVWDLMQNSLISSFKDKNINLKLSDLLDYHEKVTISYSRDFALNLIRQFEQLGSYELIKNHIEKDGILSIARIIDYVKTFFKEPNLLNVYGKNAYKHWHSNNKIIHIEQNLRTSKISSRILKAVIYKVYEVLMINNFSVNNEFILRYIIDFFSTSELFKFNNIEIPNILRFGRIAYLLRIKSSMKILINFFYYIIKFVRKIQSINESGHTTSYSKLTKEFNLIFYHHQQVKEIINDLNNVFNTSLKVRRQNENGKYKWNINLIFKWNYKNFHNINDSLLKKGLGEVLNKVENGDYEEMIFEKKNPSCSQFYVRGSTSHHLRNIEFKPLVDQMINRKIILSSHFSELGKKLIDYIKLARIHYKNNKKAFSEKSNKILHDYLQLFIREKSNYIIVTELLVWLPINDPSINADYIYGHIDFLFYFNDTLYVCDYKPLDRSFFRSLPQICLYGLILDKMLNIPNLKIKCITFNQKESWEYSPSILYTYVEEIIKKIKRFNPKVKTEWNNFLHLVATIQRIRV
ncbi:hypothetical protein LCGC14_1278760, partial [marine sediment metagenome]